MKQSMKKKIFSIVWKGSSRCKNKIFHNTDHQGTDAMFILLAHSIVWTSNYFLFFFFWTDICGRCFALSKCSNKLVHLVVFKINENNYHWNKKQEHKIKMNTDPLKPHYSNGNHQNWADPDKPFVLVRPPLSVSRVDW